MPEISYGGLIDSVSLPITAEIRESQWVAIDIQIDARSNLVGRADYGKYVPRLWSGYWYLSRNESICKNGAIEFQRMRIYEHKYPSVTHILNKAYADIAQSLYDFRQALTLNQNFKPRDLEMLAFSWAKAASSIGNADGLCYEIMPHPIDKLLLYVPAGVELTVTFRWEPYCSMFDINPDETSPELFISEPTEPTTPTETLNPLLDIVPPPQTFDEFARAQGYIPLEECGAPPLPKTLTITSLIQVTEYKGSYCNPPRLYDPVVNIFVGVGYGYSVEFSSANPTANCGGGDLLVQVRVTDLQGFDETQVVAQTGASPLEYVSHTEDYS